MQSFPRDPGAERLPPPPPDIADASLFFDFDGTLVEIAATPDAVRVEAALLDRLARLSARLPGRVGIVSGRSLAQLDGFFGPAGAPLAFAGSHGAEQRPPHGPAVAPERIAALDRAAAALAAFADTEGVLLEHKSLGIALHYRADPSREAAAITEAERVASAEGLVLQRGKMMVEVRAPGDKGTALRILMEHGAMAGTRPFFFGDDITDEDGFAAAAALGGAGVLIGALRATSARYRLDNVAAVGDWIDGVLAL